MDQDLLDQVSGQQAQPGQALNSTANSPAASAPGGGDLLDQLASQNQQQTQQPATPSADSSLDVDDPNAGILTRGARAVNAVGAGVGKGLLDTLSGAAGLVGADSIKNRLDQGRQQLDTDNQNNPTLNKIGYGGETLLEFMMGDEALKGLSFADRLTEVSKVAKLLEKSPRLLNAVKIGANAAAVQGGQTAIRTDGTVGQRLEAGAETGAETGIAGGIIGGATDALTSALAKAGVTTETFTKMLGIGKTAPEATKLAQDLASEVNNAKQGIDSYFDAAKDSVKNTRDSDISNAQYTQRADTQTANDTLDQAHGTADAAAEQQNTDLKNRTNQQKGNVQSALEQAKQDAVDKFKESASGLVPPQGAADPEELADIVDKGINQREESSHTDYEGAINGEKGVVAKLEGQTVPSTGTKMSAQAAKILKEPPPDTHVVVKMGNEAEGQKLDGKVKEQLEALSKGTRPVEQTGPDGKKIKIDQPISPYRAKDLIALRQSYRAQQGNFLRGDINRRYLGQMIGAVDDTLSDMAEASKKPEAVAQLQSARAKYADARDVLDTKTADKLSLTDPDKALANVNDFLFSGKDSPAKISTLRRIIGDGRMQQLGQTWLDGFKDMITEDPDKALKTITNMNPAARAAFFDPEVDGQIQKAAEVYKQSVDYAEQRAAGQGQAIADSLPNDQAAIKASTQSVKDTASSTNAQDLLDINDRAKRATDIANVLHDQAMKNLSSIEAGVKAPLQGGFVKSLMSGDVNTDLMKGNVKVSDIKDARKLIGDDKWNDVAQDVFQRAVADATTAGQPNPAKLWNWWSNISEDIREAMFNARGNKVGLDTFMSQVKDARTVQNLIKAGVAVPLAGGGLSLLPHGAAYTLLEAAAGAAGYARRDMLNKLLDYVATRPVTRAVTKGIGKAASKVAPNLTGTISSGIGGQVGAGLTGQVTNSLNGNNEPASRVYRDATSGLAR